MLPLLSNEKKTEQNALAKHNHERTLLFVDHGQEFGHRVHFGSLGGNVAGNTVLIGGDGLSSDWLVAWTLHVRGVDVGLLNRTNLQQMSGE